MNKYRQRQSELLGVLVVLQREGIEVEKVYSDIVSGKISVSEADGSKMVESVSQLKLQENKMYHKCRKIKLDSSADADHSSKNDIIK